MRFLYSIIILIVSVVTLYGGGDIRSDFEPNRKIQVSTNPELSLENRKKAHAMTEFFLFLNGVYSSRKGKVSEAQFAHLCKAIESDPDSPELLLFASSALKSDPKLRDSRLAVIAELAKKNPEAVPLNLFAATLLGHEVKDEKIFKKNLSTGIILLEESLKHVNKKDRKEEKEAILRLLALLHASAKDFDKADELLEELLESVSPKKKAEWFQIALSVYLEALKHASDEKPFPFGWFADSPKERYTGKFQKVLDEFSEFLTSPDNEWNAEVLAPAAEILRYKGKEDLALLILASPLFSDPGNLRILKRLASYYYVSKDYANSARLWKTILSQQKNPKPYDFIMYGQALLNSGDADKAYQVFLIQLKRFPKVSLPPNIFALTAFFAGKYQVVFDFVNRFRNPSPHLLYLKASAEAKAGKYSAAVDTMLKYLSKIGSKDSKLYQERAIQLVLFAEKAKRYDKAAEILDPMIRKNPKNPELLNLLGYLYADAGIHLEKAGELLKKALEYDPENYAILDSMAWLLYRQKKYKEAWKYICRSLELQKKKELDADGVILDHAGDIALKLGMKKEAVSYWKAALSIYSPDTNRTEIMEKIRKAEN